ncbi:hypothetical protein [Sphingopyxis alaskensis]|jgi:hypothetical protein|uniref:Uncharacterized protein n=1 Tax=Sphingopyxis alaskensis (strain DSM 13593 / LMG 18877 / RB2256) TaxID=317655 RepID=Q1GPN5_SPHAL|nr:hypothetical protein [Sphingopyxis alaskensis]ABF54387.1 hypothetical protein Sala_2682 [Sphingopyxis alaskensis RB2256]
MMRETIAKLADQNVRRAIGLHFEAFVNDAFQVVRWSAMVGFAQFLAARYPKPLFSLLYWCLASLLFGYIASRFLLRPEIRIFPTGASRWQRFVQSAFNFLLCIVLFLGLLSAIAAVTNGIAEHRFAQ